MGTASPRSPASLHVDAALSDFAVAYSNRNFLADILCPVVDVDKRSDKFFKRTRRDVSHIVDDIMGPKSEANTTSYEVTTDNYSVQDRALKDYVSGAEIRNADAPLDPRELATANIMQRLMLARENRVATLLCTSGNYNASNTAAAGGGAWSNETSSTPIADINGAIEAIPNSGAESSLVAFCALPVWNALRKHPSLLALKGIDKGLITEADFASFFGLQRLVVSDLRKETANIGQTASYGWMYTSTVFGIVRIPSVLSGADVSAFSVTFRAAPGIQVRTWDAPEIGMGGSEGIQVEMSDDEKVVQNDMGYLLTSVL